MLDTSPSLPQSRSPCVHVDPCSARYHPARPLPAANTTTQPGLSEEVLAQRAAAAVAAEAGAEVEEERMKRRGGKRKSNDDKEQQNGRDGTKKVKQRPRLGAGVNSNSHVLSLPVPHSQHRVQHPHPTHPPPLLNPPRRNLHPRHPHPVIDENTPHTLYQERHRGQLFDSPLFSSSASVSSKRGKTKISPIRAVTSGKGWDAAEEDEDEDEEEEERLSRELDDALEELDVPSSSLPIASSDFGAEPPATSSSSGGYLSAAEEEQDGEDETMRYWSTGLPPSSPPPPTSPILQSQTDDEDMDDISNAMSDSDGLMFEQNPLDQQDQFLSGYMLRRPQDVL
jgi:hypothetical protein